MRRAVALIAAVLAVAVVAACGASRPRLWTTPTHTFRASACASADCGAYAITLNWGAIQWAHTTTGYDLFLNGSQVGSTTASSYSFTGMDCGTTFSLGVQAHDGSGDTSQTYTTSYSTPACPAAPQTLNCFSSPSACGYPDPSTPGIGAASCSSLVTPTSGNLPAGWTMTGGNEISPTTSGTAGNPNTLSGYNITGQWVWIGSYSYIKLSNDCLDAPKAGFGNYGADNGFGNLAQSSGTNLTIDHVTAIPTGCSAAYNTVCATADASNTNVSTGANATITNSVFAGASESLHPGNNSTITGNYIIANGQIASPHQEDFYFLSAVGENIQGNTILNPDDQQSAIFAEVSSNTACAESFTIKGNLMAGGIITTDICVHSNDDGTARPGTATVDYENNDLARCAGAATYDSGGGGYYCAGGVAPSTQFDGSTIGAGADTHGYLPRVGYGGAFGGYWGDPGWTCIGNFYDDTGAPVSCS